MRTSGFRLGRILGIDVYVDWSWLFIFFLVTANLSAVLSQAHAQWIPGLRWGAAAFAALLFFASVLAHELAHSLVARSRGIPVRSITLFLFGGVSNIQREPASPRSEFLMAIVGPLTSIVIGGLLLLLARSVVGPLTADVGDPAVLARLGPVASVLLWLGSINLMLGFFNLVPGFPLDGGRVLRSLLWALVGNLRRATHWASRVGQAIAWLMIVAGASMIFGARVPLLGEGLVNGLWIMFIGWFLNNAAAQSYRQVVINDILGGVPVVRLMRTDPPTCTPQCTVSSLVHDHVMTSDDHAFPVLDGGKLVGIVSLDDVRKVPHSTWDVVTVEQIMTPAAKLIVIGPEEDAAEALNKLAQYDIRQLPVLQGGEMIGLLRRQDIVRWLQFVPGAGK